MTDHEHIRGTASADTALVLVAMREITASRAGLPEATIIAEAVAKILCDPDRRRDRLMILPDPVVELCTELRALPERRERFTDDPKQVRDYVLHHLRSLHGSCADVRNAGVYLVHPSYDCTHFCAEARAALPPKQLPTPDVDRWLCERCFLQRPVNQDECESCGTPRPSGQVVASTEGNAHAALATSFEARVDALDPDARALFEWFQQLSGVEFSAAVAWTLQASGYLVNTTLKDGAHDGGIDITGYHGRELVAIQVKRRSTSTEDVRGLRQAAREHQARPVLVSSMTTSRFAELSAADAVAAEPVTVIDGVELAQLAAAAELAPCAPELLGDRLRRAKIHRSRG